jgi:hypothetical protein
MVTFVSRGLKVCYSGVLLELGEGLCSVALDAFFLFGSFSPLPRLVGTLVAPVSRGSSP